MGIALGTTLARSKAKVTTTTLLYKEVSCRERSQGNLFISSVYTFRDFATHCEVVARKTWALEAYNVSLGKSAFQPAAARLALGLAKLRGL